MTPNERENQGQAPRSGQQQQDQDKRDQNKGTTQEGNPSEKVNKENEEGTKMPGRETRTPVAGQQEDAPQGTPKTPEQPVANKPGEQGSKQGGSQL
jgi:hypothetical protein